MNDTEELLPRRARPRCWLRRGYDTLTCIGRGRGVRELIMIKKLWVLTLVVAVTALGGAAQAGPTLDKVKQAGRISCGVPTGVAGFAAPDSQGRWAGFDIDICRALSAAFAHNPPIVLRMARRGS